MKGRYVVNDWVTNLFLKGLLRSLSAVVQTMKNI
jgi:hypothetical protein